MTTRLKRKSSIQLSSKYGEIQKAFEDLDSDSDSDLDSNLNLALNSIGISPLHKVSPKQSDVTTTTTTTKKKKKMKRLIHHVGQHY